MPKKRGLFDSAEAFLQTSIMLLDSPYILIKNRKRLLSHTKNWLVFTVVSAVFSLIFLDAPLSQFFGHPSREKIWLMAREVTNIGLGEHYFGFCFLVLIFIYYIHPRYYGFSEFSDARFIHNEQKINYLKVWAWNFLAALLTAGISLRVLKFIFGRQRPHLTDTYEPWVFHFFSHHWDYQSMPSGHSQVLFSVATLLMVWDVKRSYFIMWSWLWFVVAAIFAFTRVMTLDHFLSDVIVGATLGYIGSLWGLHLMYTYSRHKLID